MKRFGLAIALVLAAGAARAATLGGVTLPDRYPVAGQTLVLNGIGLRTFSVLGVRIYVAGLYLAQPSHDTAQILASPGPKVLLLQYLHAGSKAEVQKEYRKGEQENCGGGGCLPSDEPDFERLVAAAPGVKAGDTTTYIINGGTLQVFANNQPLITLNNKDLANRMLAGFIGDHPPTPELRNALLGMSNR